MDEIAPALTAGVAERAPPLLSPAPARKWHSRAGFKRAVRTSLLLAFAAIVPLIVFRAVTRPGVVPVGSVVMTTIREEIVGPGSVQSRYSVSVGSRVAGTIDRVLVDVGDEVEKDQLLATVDRTELEARFRATHGAVASAQQDIALARANLAKARSDLDLARIRDDRSQNLVGAGVASTAEADDMRGALGAAEANERAARAAVAARMAEHARLSQEQRVAETILSYTSLESPMAGVITRRALEPGSAVPPGAVVVQIVDASALWVATMVDQSLAGRVRVGQRASIRLRSGAELTGHVARIAFEADPITRELEIDVAFDERPKRFAIHEEADVTIFGEQVQGLTVPLEALSHGPEGSGVYVVEAGKVRHRTVRLGLLGAKTALVTQGLSVGEQVVLTPNVVREGQRVAATGQGR